MQGIAIGWSQISDGLICYCPHSKKTYTAKDYTMDEGRSTANAFNLKYDGGIFVGLYDNGPASLGTELFPEGTRVIVNGSPGRVVSVPRPAASRNIPDTHDSSTYVIQCGSDVIRVSAPDMNDIIAPTTDSRDGKDTAPPPLLVPSWIANDEKVMVRFNGKWNKGYLELSKNNQWRFSARHRNGIERWGVDLPDLHVHFQSLINQHTIVPGWHSSPPLLQGQASHVSAAGLTQLAPGSMHKAFCTDHPDAQIWHDSYAEEYNGLCEHDTFEIISENEYQAIRKDTGSVAIPSMGIFTIKPDAEGNPI